MSKRRPTSPANRLNLDYAAEARDTPAPAPIIDVHTHITGPRAASVYAQAARDYGITLTYSMTPLDRADEISEAMSGRIRFIAMAEHRDEDFRAALTDKFLAQIEAFHARGDRIVKIWAAPRGIDYGQSMGFADAFRLDADHNVDAMRLAQRLGMAMMVHVADPDTWFATKYADASRYGTKADQYKPLRRALDEFTIPFIAAHMGGWPEDLDFLSQMLGGHPNLYLDTSATKWMVRELSKHPTSRFTDFLDQWRGRILFGSDIVANDEHVVDDAPSDAAGTSLRHAHPDAFDLYASRYWVLRTLLESDYVGESPIADPDLAMIDPEEYGPLAAPRLTGHHLPNPLLRAIYHDAAHVLLEPLHQS